MHLVQSCSLLYSEDIHLEEEKKILLLMLEYICPM